MRICLATTSQPVDYSRFLYREAASLARAGHEVLLLGLPAGAAVQAPPGVWLQQLRRQRRFLGKFAAIGEIVRIVRRGAFDVCHCCDPWALIAGLLLRFSGRCTRLIYESVENFPVYYRDRQDLNRFVTWTTAGIVTALEHLACRAADAIIETNHTRARRFHVCRRPVEIVGNFPPLDLPVAKADTIRSSFVFTGPITRHRGFLKILEAAAIVRRESSEFRLKVIGAYDPVDNIAAEVNHLLVTHGLVESVVFLGTRDYRAMFQELNDCIAGFVLLSPVRENDRTGQPNKLFEFMASGLAVIASDLPEIAPIVQEEKCGLIVDEQDPVAVAAAIRELLKNRQLATEMGRRGQAAVRQKYNWSVAEGRLLAIYSRLSC